MTVGMGTVSLILQEFCSYIYIWTEIRSQLLEHITTKYLRTRTTPFADIDPGDVPMSSELEQVLPKKSAIH